VREKKSYPGISGNLSRGLYATTAAATAAATAADLNLLLSGKKILFVD